MQREQQSTENDMRGREIDATQPKVQLADEERVAQALMQMQAESMQAIQQTLMAGLEEIRKAALAPKQITVERGPRGQITGATSSPMTVQ